MAILKAADVMGLLPGLADILLLMQFGNPQSFRVKFIVRQVA